jgi:hypothetical protein
MRKRSKLCAVVIAVLSMLPTVLHAQQAVNLLPDPSIEETRPKNQFGIPFAKWGGWLFEGVGEFRNGKIARTGKTCAEMVGGQGVKMRLYTPPVTVEAGRYRFSCYLRGLDIGVHAWGLSEDFSFADDNYVPMKKTGTFGWTKLECVKDVPEKKEIVARIGLWAPGRLWVDDAELVKVGNDVPLTDGPVLGREEQPIEPPGEINPATAVRCPDCGYRNMPEWGKCYVCGADLASAATKTDLPPVKQIASFEDGTVKPFSPAATAAVQEHATDGKWSMRLDKDWVAMDVPQDWTGYDFVKVDVFNPSDTPTAMYVEVRDKATTDYWTRVNYNTVVPQGASTLIMPTDLYVGEKSRPGRPLDKANITRFVFALSDANGPLYFDNLRLERDLSDSVKVPGLQAYSFGPGAAPPMRGFTGVSPSTNYSPGRGYGFKNARIWRAFDFLQPDPLYQYAICIEGGSFVTDVPDGRYHVFINLDNPSGFWGEYQIYRQRVVKANGLEVVHDTLDLDAFRKKYFRFADTEDSPEENTFDKYQKPYFQEKEFDVDVKGGQLNLEFQGENWANSVSALVIYPDAQAELGRKYLDNLRERRRFYFDNYFKRVLPDPHRDGQSVIPDFVPTTTEQAAGFVTFARDWMRDVNVNAIPRREEVTRKLDVFASAGELEPVVFSVYPLRDLGEATVSATDLSGPNGRRIPASAVQLGVVSHRLSRVTMEGSVYTIAPRFVMPRATAPIRKGVTTTFWLTLHVPKPVTAGTYSGKVKLTLAGGKTETLDLSARLFATPLDELDVAAGPWGCNISLPWYQEDLGDYDKVMFRKCLAKMREYGCTTFSGIPQVAIRGWKEGKPDIDFTTADWQMNEAKAAGFKDLVVNYGSGIGGMENYRIDDGAMKAGGFTKYTDFLRAVLTTIDAHAKAAGWLPVAYNLCDEPMGDAIAPTVDNAKAWREAAPAGMLTTGATSIESPKPDDPHIPLVQALKVPDLNGHDEAAIKLIHDAGNDWAFYNGGNRWTFGTYMYKCVHEYGMKFRLSWHWNASAGDPYYALDCREDDYSWCSSNTNMDLIPTIHFEREIREGIDDYRYMQTLARLIHDQPTHPAAAAAKKLIDDKLASFKLGERDHDAKWPAEEFRAYRLQLAETIEKLSR